MTAAIDALAVELDHVGSIDTPEDLRALCRKAATALRAAATVRDGEDTVERVAMAIFEHGFQHGDFRWHEQSLAVRDKFRGAARAALKATP